MLSCAQTFSLAMTFTSINHALQKALLCSSIQIGDSRHAAESIKGRPIGFIRWLWAALESVIAASPRR